LLRAYSGRDMNTLQLDAGYRYYLHGPLARIEWGDGLTGRLVQGSDYAYTLQGWLKGVNGVQLSSDGNGPADTDAGADGSPLKDVGIHAEVGADVIGFTLGYYKEDYKPIGGSLSGSFGTVYRHPAPASTATTGKELFDGNISNAVYSLAGIDNGYARGYSFGYDQLNRLCEMRAHNLASIVPGATWNNGSILEEHRESFGYDANGNITNLFRNGTASGGRRLAMDGLSYRYYYYTLNNIRKTYAPSQPLPADAWLPTNQLAYISDAVPDANYPAVAYPSEKDIDSQDSNNYGYDGIGNLVKDKSEGITKIGWTVYGKISSINKADGTRIVFDYDAAGNRIQKQVVAGGKKTISFYVRDTRGNTMAVYGWRGNSNARPIVAGTGNGLTGQIWDEQVLYGSRRLGIWNPGITVPASLDLVTGAVQTGSKLFELTNHLGNVLAIISDKKIAVPASGNAAVTDHYAAELISSGDYTPFGMLMAGRSYHLPGTTYRYGFNNKENDNEVKGEGNQQDYGMRAYDPRVGRFLSIDPVAVSYPMLTPYQFGSNNPISGIDQDGLEYEPAGKVGIFNIDQTAVQLYPDNPGVILQQKADAPMVHLFHMVNRVNTQPAFLSTQWQPANELEKQRHAINREAWYDRDGYNTDGSPKPTTRLSRDRTWNAFAVNLALPFFDAVSYTDGGGEAKALFKGVVSFLEKREFETIAKTGMV
ncbi:MAG: RHS repeat-associated core domain-containing protein, partial [Bacteroidota bacterium]